MIVTRAGVSLISGTQNDIILSPGDQANSLKIRTKVFAVAKGESKWE